LDVIAHRRSNLDHRGVHLRFNLLLKDQLAFFDNFGMNMRAQIAGDGINRLKFFFDADREGWRHGFHQRREGGRFAGSGNDPAGTLVYREVADSLDKNTHEGWVPHGIDTLRASRRASADLVSYAALP